MHVFALEEHAAGGGRGGEDGGGGVGAGEAVEAVEVGLVGARVGGAGEDEEVVGELGEGFGVAAGDYCVGGGLVLWLVVREGERRGGDGYL